MNCRSCQSEKLTEILDLGVQYTSDFRTDKSKPPKYPLRAVICEDCMLVQLDFPTPSKDMYHDNYGFKSGVSENIKTDLMTVVLNASQHVDKPRTWLDIASNDGTLLSFVPPNVYKVGVDPITKYCEEAKQHANKIVNDFFRADLLMNTDYDIGGAITKQETFDVVTSISCFYDMDDPNSFVSDVKKVLVKNGVWVIQQNYLLTTMELGAVDNFCAEHLEYYTLLSLEPLLERHGLEVIEVSTSMVNGGSIRTIVAHKGQHPVQDSVEKQRAIELDAGLDKPETYKDFATKAMKNIEELKDLVARIKAEGKSVAILAASTRGSTIWQCAGFTEKEIDYAVERNPEKVGKYFSAIGVPIVSEGKFREDHPDYAIIGPWFFSNSIVDREKEYLRKGGCLIEPLPKVSILKSGLK